MKILLIEDKPSEASLIKDLCKLNIAEASVTIANTLEEGLQKIEIIDPDLIVLDLGLPDSDGLDTLFKTKACTLSPIVILSGYENEDLAIKAVKNGAEDYLIKGVNPQTLCRSLKFAIQRHARKELSPHNKAFDRRIDQLKNIVNSLNHTKG